MATRNRVNPSALAFACGLGVLVLIGLAIVHERVPVSRGWQQLLIALLITVMFLGHWITGRWRGILIDSRNRISLSRFQAVAWTLVVLSGYGAAVLANLRQNPSIAFDVAVPQELWLALGISAVSLAGSPLIKTRKKESGTPKGSEELRARERLRAPQVQAGARTEGVLVTFDDAKAASWRDLFEGEEVGNLGLVALGKLQMFLFTLLLVSGYALSLFRAFLAAPDPIIGLPALSGGAIALLGVSHAGYLADKSVPHTGVGNRSDESTLLMPRAARG